MIPEIFSTIFSTMSINNKAISQILNTLRSLLDFILW